MTDVYDLGRWSRELAFWPAESEDFYQAGRQLFIQRCGELLAHLARWMQQEGNQCMLWHRLIELQRQRLMYMMAAQPELRLLLKDADCLRAAWLGALLKVIGENNCFDLPDACPWTLEQALTKNFFP